MGDDRLIDDGSGMLQPPVGRDFPTQGGSAAVGNALSAGESAWAAVPRRDDPGRAELMQSDPRDVEADGRTRDAVADIRDGAAEGRNEIADERDALGQRRDADADRRDMIADSRDATGDRRDSAGDTRDAAAMILDEAASQRDQLADQRDRAADQRDRDVERSDGSNVAAGARHDREHPVPNPRLEAATDRHWAREDRTAAALARNSAAVDRVTASADRHAGADGRGSSRLDRSTALADRGGALADRVAGANRRDSSDLDRGTALGDRAAARVDRRSAVEYAALDLRMAEDGARAWRLLQQMSDPVVVTNSDGIIQLINFQAVLLFGYQPDELIGHPVEQLLPDGLHEQHRRHRADYVATEHPVPMSTRSGLTAVRKDGTTIPVDVSLRALHLPTGRAILACVRDISDRSLADAELRIGDERFRQWFDRASIGMTLIDLHPDTAGRFLRVNEVFCRLTGYTEAQLLATTSGAITHPEDRADSIASIDRLARGLSARWDSDKRYRTADGGDLWVHVTVSVVHDAQGRLSYAASQVEDITVRKRAEAQMAERFRELATNVDVGFLVCRLDPPEYLYFNPAYLTVFGFDPAGPHSPQADSTALDGLLSDDRVGELLSMAGGGHRAEQEWQFTRPDGEQRWVSSRISPITDPDGQIRRVAGLFEDVTARKDAEAEILSARADALRANTAKNEFLSRLGHELRTPLNAVIGFAQLLELDSPTATQADAVGYILRGGRHLLAMIDDILDINGIDTDRLELWPEDVDLDELLTDTIGMMQSLATTHQIPVRFHPGAPDSPHVTADRRRLKQVMINLLSNAIKYNRTGGVVDITVEAMTAHQIGIAVKDSGIGIPAADLPRLFNPFDRLGRQASNIEGTGIGLSLSKRLVTLMGGQLQVETNAGIGSTFTVILPQAATSKTGPPPADFRPSAAATPPIL